MLKLRELSWVTYISSNLDPKKMAKNIEQFWPLKPKKRVSDKAKQALIEAQLKYMKERDG